MEEWPFEEIARWRRYEEKHGPVHAPWWERRQMAMLLSFFVAANGGRCDVEEFLPPWEARARDIKGPPTDAEIMAAFAGWGMTDDRNS